MPRMKTNRPRPAVAKPASSFFISGGAATFIEAAAAKDGAPKARPKFSMIAYNGGMLRLNGFYLPVVVDLKGLRASQNTTILLDHDRTQIVGQATRTEITATQVKLEGQITGDDEPATKVLMHAANGFKWPVSFGVEAHEWQYLSDKETAVVNGKSVKGPAYIARIGRLGEVSFVGVGADEKASSRIAAAAMEITAMNFAEWLKAKGFDEATLSEPQRATLEAAWKADQELAASGAGGTGDDDEGEQPDDEDPPARRKPKKKAAGRRLRASGQTDDLPTSDDLLAQMRDRASAEIERQNAIRAACGDRHADIAAKAIKENWTADRTELEVLRAGAPRVSGVRGDNRPGGPARHRIIEAALARNYNLVAEANLGKHWDDKTVEAALSREGRRISLHGLLYEVAAAGGNHITPGNVDAELIRAAFHADRQIVASGGFSTISLSGILSNVANKALLEQYLQAASVVGDIAYETDAADFKSFTRYRLDGKGELTEVGQNGELKHIGLQESSFANRLKTYGGIIALTREMMINDDLGAFMQIPQIFGQLAAAVREQMVIAAILANTGTFFASGDGNYFEGADSALSIGALETAEKLFLELKNANGQFIRRIPDRLLVPPALKALATRINVSDMLVATTTANKALPATNTYKGSFRPVCSPYLGTSSGLSGASDTGWYMLPPPGPTGAIVQVAYLRGQRLPVIESGETDFNTLGMQWRSYFDFGVSLFDPTSGVFSKGTT